MKNDDKYNFLLIFQFLIVMAAIFGSLFFSEIMGYPPCNLCWYQRLCVYPMAFIILTGLYLNSKETVTYLIPFSITGLGISIYHNLVYYKVITVIVPCSASAPCTAQHINWFGFVTIPLLSLLMFVFLVALNFATISILKKDKGSYEK
jgi:disulfide bond formation protein DsbB